MIKNYLKIALRNLVRNRANSFIHIFGLTIGLTGCLLIGLFVQDEFRYDRFHPDVERIYRIYSERGGSTGGDFWAGTSPVINPTLERDFPEVEQTLRLHQIRSKQLFENGETAFLEERGFFAESSIFDMFQLPFLHGDPQTALREINSVVLTAELAEKYFGDENPVGKAISINDQARTVTGVLRPLPRHFHLNFNFLISFENLLAAVSEERINSWIWQDFLNYVKFYPQTNVKRFAEKLPAFVEEYAHPNTKERGFYYYLHLQKLSDIYLHSSKLRNDPIVKGNFKSVVALSLVGIFLLFIACINFINLTTAQAVRRAREVGVRKVAGAFRGQLVTQFIGEATLIVTISMLLAAQFTYLLLPYLNDFTDKTLVFDWYKNPLILALMVGIIVVTGGLAGSYPAIVMSGFRPVKALKAGSFQPSGHIAFLRKGLVTLQFVLSIGLIISVLIIYQQVNFLRNKDLGFAKDQLLHFPMKNALYENFDHTRSAFLEIPGVISASTCFGIPGDIIAGDDIIIPGESPKNLPARIFAVDHEYVQTMGMKIIAGRDFSKEIRTDAAEAFIVNETAVKKLEIAQTPEAAVGKRLAWQMWDEAGTIKKGRIIGVVEDFHYNSLHEKVQTAVLHIYPDAYWKLALRVSPQNLDQTIASLQKTWDRFDTGYPIDYQFVDEGFGAMYEAEGKLNTLLWIFTILSIVVSCIGAFGLASYAATQRRKEIGIRKVLGASVESIVALLTKDFLKLILIALFVAAPPAWYFMNNWLADFAYRIDIEWSVFLLAGLFVIVIAFLTVSFQSVRAAVANPVDSLRNE